MSISGLWNALEHLMTDAALLVDVLRPVLLWACALLLPVYLIALAIWVLDRLSDDGSGDGCVSPHRPLGFRGRLDQMMNLSISQRPATRKRRHRHHHHPHHPTPTLVV